MVLVVAAAGSAFSLRTSFFLDSIVTIGREEDFMNEDHDGMYTLLK